MGRRWQLLRVLPWLRSGIVVERLVCWVALGAIRTASARNHQRRALVVSTTIELPREVTVDRIVAVVAAYSSYEHQRGFALRFGADSTSVALWRFDAVGDAETATGQRFVLM